MKKLFTIMIVLFAFGTTIQAQNTAINACFDGDTLQLSFDYSQNCALAGTGMAGIAEMGYHSGVDGWATVVNWDDATATTGINNGADVFVFRFHSLDYYGLAAAPTGYNFVFNQGPEDPANPWANEAKDSDNNNDGSCDDFYITYADLQTCATSTKNIEQATANQAIIAPNPMIGSMTSLLLENPNNEVYTMVITNMMGQIIRTQTGVSGNNVTIERGEMTTGIYNVVLTSDKNGRSIATRFTVVR